MGLFCCAWNLACSSARVIFCSVIRFCALVCGLFLILPAPGAVSAQQQPPRTLRASVSAPLDAPGRLEVRALAAAYPERIDETALRNEDWAARIDDTWYYWADGRMLPYEERFDNRRYTGIRFYNYALGPLQLREIDEATAERLRERSRQPASAGLPRHNGFLDALYGISTRSDAYRWIVDTTFLGLKTQAHRMIVEPLSSVERQIRSLMVTDAEVRAFVAELQQVSTFSWREIAGTNRRSYHSYGVAVDLIPRSYHGRFGYWRWAMQSGIEEWWDVPPEQRWRPPQPVIDAFENNGFVWGGKWLSFDPIHFEYRPEVILLARWREAGIR
ncbi:MAG: M15 family peptidase [Spirochaetaceae bacterium]|nr:MAG: M15 family peptidase [Spirochaetaceae bacterium]